MFIDRDIVRETRAACRRSACKPVECLIETLHVIQFLRERETQKYPRTMLLPRNGKLGLELLDVIGLGRLYAQLGP